VDLVAAVLAAVGDVDAHRKAVLPAAVAAFASLAAGVFAWRRPRRALWVPVAFHVLVAAAALLILPRTMKTALPVFLLVPGWLHVAAAVLAAGGALGAARLAEEEEPEAVGAAARAVHENFESVVVAIVFALVVRHFAVEAFKIPTESMSPTLLGDHAGRGPGDRVLVAKWPALLSRPGRYEVWVFRYPLFRPQAFIKRLCGLPGERIEIRGGDLYAGGVVTRKPPRIREAMWFPVWPDPWTPRPASACWSGPGWRLDGAAFRVSGAKERSLLAWSTPVTDATPGGGGRNPVGDLRVRFEVGDPEPGTKVVARVVGRAGPCEVVLDAAGGGGRSSTPAGEVVLADVPALAGREVEVCFADLEWRVLVDGTEIARADLPEPGDSPANPSYHAAFGVEGGGASFGEVRLDRDVFYTREGQTDFQVPAGHYLFLGDNSKSSSDGRRWVGRVVTEKGPGGRTWRSDWKEAERWKEQDGEIRFLDEEGIARVVRRSDVEIGEERVSFVAEEDLVGRAFAVFWPLPFTTATGGRLKLLR